MTYAELTTAKKRHELAAKTIRFAGFSAKCVKNTLCDQPYQVDVKCTEDEAKALQMMICNLLKDDTLNVVAQ